MSNSQPEDLTSMEGLLGQAVWLRGCALRMGYRRESAEDAVQETLLAAQAEAASLGAGWLRRTLQRKLGMQLRSERRRAQREAESARPEAQDLDPARRLEQLELQQEIQRAIAQLPRHDREVLALRFVAELSVQEIAESLGQTPNAVSSRLSRALKRLRTILRPDAAQGAPRRWLASLSVPVAKQLHVGTPSVAAASTVPPHPWAASLAIPMKKFLVILFVLALVALGSLALPEDPSSAPSLERHSSTVLNDQPESLRTPETDAGPREPGAPAAPAERTVLASEEAPAESEPVAIRPALELGRVRVLCQEEGSASPIAGMDIELLPEDEGVLSFRPMRVQRTNERGEAFFDDVAPGRVAAVLTRFGGTGGRHAATVEVTAGETTEVRFELDARHRTRGIVVDESGRPVPDAELWVGHRPGPVEKGYPVGRSGPDGRFDVKYVAGAQFLCARAAGYAPSLSAAPDFTRDYADHGLRLVLGVRHGSLRGTVRSLAGTPLEGVTVSVGDMTRPADGATYDWTTIPQSQKTGAGGTFEFPELRIGEVSVRARGHRAAPWSRSVVITDGGSVELDIELGEGGTLVGRVLTAQGGPASNARIAAFPGEDTTVPQAATRTDDEGRYRLSQVSAGEMFLLAESEGEDAILRETLYIEEGVEQAWNPVLSTARNLAGHVVSEAGAPLSGWYVSARGIVGGVPAQNSSGATVHADGSFEVEREPADAYEIRVYPPGRFIGPPALLLESFGPPAGDPSGNLGEGLRLIVPDDKTPTASLRGQLVAEDGEALTGPLTLTVATTPATRVHGNTSPDGRFRFDYLPEGSFTLTLRQGSETVREHHCVGPLVRDEARDLGRVTL
ncbi:RNA polymerase sigma factor [Planctomycetes bacterium Poly30]|uniref:RNA polymerase sigma factor n=1 Tax=Saltatorellus ferox TaxID=2528018 RepID=A0A518F0H8_9BACT|nr:RNA polymerase sigma factor [Planctomycetes bacterium Poly30]